MREKEAAFNSLHLVFAGLSKLLRHFVEIHQIHYREFTCGTRMDNRKFHDLLAGRDLKLNYYLRFLDYIATYFETAQGFWEYVLCLLRAALRDMAGIMGRQEVKKYEIKQL